MPSSLFREITAGVTMMICTGVFVVFALATLRTYQLYRHNGWWKEVYPPLSVTTFMLGAAIYNGGAWFSRHLYNQDFEIDHLINTFTALIVFGMAFKILGGMLMIRQFSLQHWHHWPWIITLLASAAFGAYCYFSYPHTN